MSEFTLTWRDVFDCKAIYGHIDNIVSKMSGTGYKYFVWNGRVYQLIANNDYKATGYVVEDLD